MQENETICCHLCQNFLSEAKMSPPRGPFRHWHGHCIILGVSRKAKRDLKQLTLTN